MPAKVADVYGGLCVNPFDMQDLRYLVDTTIYLGTDVDKVMAVIFDAVLGEAALINSAELFSLILLSLTSTSNARLVWRHKGEQVSDFVLLRKVQKFYVLFIVEKPGVESIPHLMLEKKMKSPAMKIVRVRLMVI